MYFPQLTSCVRARDFKITPETSDLLSFMEEFELFNLIKEPICFKFTNNPSCIDLNLTNQKYSF